jgi:hypothetical protein
MERDSTRLDAAEMRFIRSVRGYTILDKIRKLNHNKRTGDLCNTRREIQIQNKNYIILNFFLNED